MPRAPIALADSLVGEALRSPPPRAVYLSFPNRNGRPYGSAYRR
jgi:hypothetical protein